MLKGLRRDIQRGKHEGEETVAALRKTGKCGNYRSYRNKMAIKTEKKQGLQRISAKEYRKKYTEAIRKEHSV